LLAIGRGEKPDLVAVEKALKLFSRLNARSLESFQALDHAQSETLLLSPED
jgi:hypothetical protein